jgi:acyl-CoA dehydrogenase
VVVDLSEDHAVFDSTVRSWLGQHLDLPAIREVVEDEDGDGHPAELWKAASDLGWLAILVPEEHGGLGLGLAEATVVVRALGSGLAPGPYLSTIVAGEAIRRAGSATQLARLLPRLASGETVATFAGAQFSTLRDDALPDVRVDRDDRASGRAGIVPFAAVADHLVLPARDADGRTRLWVVDARAPGVQVDPCGSVDGTWRVGFVRFDGAAAERLERSDHDTVRAVLRCGAVLTAADLVGVAERAHELTIGYVKDRHQFGKPIGSFQAVKHPLADIFVHLTMATKGVLYAADAADHEQADAAIMASVAKAKANVVATDAAAAIVQFHGAMGFTWLHPAHLFYKRAKRQEYEFGDTVWHRERIAALTIAAAETGS